MSRFAIAMVAYVVLALLVLSTLSDEKIRLVTLLILGLFAVRTVVQHRRADMDSSGDETQKPM